MKLDLFVDENLDPYKLPDDDVLNVINFSGGRSSGFMLYKFLYRHEGRLPDNTLVCFANTGAEREETLAFVAECEKRWGISVVWLEYRFLPDAAGGPKDLRHRHEVVSFETASRNKEPFEAMIRAKSMLPNVAQRFCTSQLKVNPVEWYIRREMGYEGKFRNILGIRYDEPKRWGKALMEECQAQYPMVHDGVRVADVLQFWKKQMFDLGIHGDKGNCDLCFLKGEGKLTRLIAEEPMTASWWIQMEENVTQLSTRKAKEASCAQFSKRFSYKDLLTRALKGERPKDDGPSIDCFCGD